MSMTGNAPKNDDPLLKAEIDFSQNMPIVILSHSRGDFIDIKIQKITRDENTLKVNSVYRKPDPSKIAAKPVSYGLRNNFV